MRAMLTYRGATYKKVVVSGAHTESDEAVLKAALTAARETKSSLFHWTIERTGPGSVLVTLHTD